ncbi:MAG TPA: nuclear transport factor 2 family protein [Candidatus Acidoferrum sp.]|nr:nuclear transport factor 2 family protein [Candidatus Acidoferrum sp.]
MLRLFKPTLLALLAVVTALVQSVFAAEPAASTRAEDTVAIQQLIVKYAHSYDALDVEGYVSVFADDASFKFVGNDLHGKDAIRKFITAAKERKDSAPATDKPTKSFHSITNTLIEFTSATEAHHRSYWQIISGPAGGPFTVSNAGTYDDIVVKRNGKWLIQSRTIPQ